MTGEVRDEARPRSRAVGVAPGSLPPGPLNAITDVEGVRVGHLTLLQGEGIRTGATAVLPHPGNLFQERVPAGLSVGNGFGKLMGSTQVMELGELETPIVLTNTLALPRAADALLDWTLARPGNEDARSVNAVVAETNDGWLNDIRARVLAPDHVAQALRDARSGPVEEGSVGAGTGTVCFGWKGGIGTSSRTVVLANRRHTVGVLVQTNYGGELEILGVPLSATLGHPRQNPGAGPGHPSQASLEAPTPGDGSVVVVVATDAPLSDRNLTRLARRALLALPRTGSWMAPGSGDYALAFSTAEGVRRTPSRRAGVVAYAEIPDPLLSPLFQAAMEATEEAIYNSLFRATTVTGYRGRTVRALPLPPVLKRLGAAGRLSREGR